MKIDKIRFLDMLNGRLTDPYTILDIIKECDLGDIDCDDCANSGKAICTTCIHYKGIRDHFESKQKIIKLDELVGSDIDMEFGNKDTICSKGKLKAICSTLGKKYKDEFGDYWNECRIRQDYWHHWNGGDCPLPEGLDIRVQYRDKQRVEGRSWQFLKTSWKHSADVNNDIIAFKVLDTAENARYEWQKEKEE